MMQLPRRQGALTSTSGGLVGESSSARAVTSSQCLMNSSSISISGLAGTWFNRRGTICLSLLWGIHLIKIWYSGQIGASCRSYVK